MNCTHCRQLLDGYADGELDPGTAKEVEAHAGQCAFCAAALEERTVLGVEAKRLPYHLPPPAWSAALRHRLSEAAAARARPRWLEVLGPAGSHVGVALASALLASVVTIAWMTPRTADDLTRQALATHVRSLMLPTHLIDVASSDRHTVKPWFQHHLDYAVDVPDLASEGFVLEGGRLEYLGGRAVAVLVFRRRQHLIDLLVFPSADLGPVKEETVRGIHVLPWERNGMRYVAVSELDPAELAGMKRAMLALHP